MFAGVPYLFERINLDGQFNNRSKHWTGSSDPLEQVIFCLKDFAVVSNQLGSEDLIRTKPIQTQKWPVPSESTPSDVTD